MLEDEDHQVRSANIKVHREDKSACVLDIDSTRRTKCQLRPQLSLKSEISYEDFVFLDNSDKQRSNQVFFFNCTEEVQFWWF